MTSHLVSAIIQLGQTTRVVLNPSVLINSIWITRLTEGKILQLSALSCYAKVLCIQAYRQTLAQLYLRLRCQLVVLIMLATKISRYR